MLLIKDNDKFKNINKILLILLIVLQPLLDTFYFYSDELVDIIGFSPSTLIRFILVGICFIITFLLINSKKKWIGLILYILVTLFYLVLHNFNCMKFNSNIANNINYSIFSEIFYVARLIIPLLVIFITFNSNLKDNMFEKVILILAIIISGSIVITNFLGISLGSYTNEIIKGNMFEWLFNGYGNYSYSDFASKGFFYFANRASTSLIIILPLIFYYFVKKPTFVKMSILFLQMLSMLMLGTKVASIGGILVIITMTIIYIFIGIMKVDVRIKLWVLIFIFSLISIWICILPKSPAIYRESIAANVNELTDQVTSNATIEKDLDEIQHISGEENIYLSKIKYIKDNYEKMKINPTFIIDSYNYENDPDFWLDIFQQPANKRMDYRYIETRMVKRVKDLNNNKWDNWFGLGYSRVTSIYNIERDFVLQYYSLGIIGLILFISPMILIILLSIVCCFVKFKQKFKMENIALISSSSLGLLVSWYSGNSLDSLFISIILAFILGKLLYNILNKEKHISYKGGK